MRRLLFEYYYHSHENRRKELLDSVNSNINSGLFDEIYIFVSKDENIEGIENNKNVHIEYGDRKKIVDLIRFLNDITNDEDINIICNTDIIFDDSIRKTEKIESKEVYALSRWKSDDCVDLVFYDYKFKPVHPPLDPILGHEFLERYHHTMIDNIQKQIHLWYSGGADTWCWRGKLEFEDEYELFGKKYIFGDYYLGYRGVDNVFSFDIRTNHYRIWNPVFEIKTIHNHKTQIRSGHSSDYNADLLLDRYGVFLPLDRDTLPRVYFNKKKEKDFDYLVF